VSAEILRFPARKREAIGRNAHLERDCMRTQLPRFEFGGDDPAQAKARRGKRKSLHLCGLWIAPRRHTRPSRNLKKDPPRAIHIDRPEALEISLELAKADRARGSQIFEPSRRVQLGQPLFCKRLVKPLEPAPSGLNELPRLRVNAAFMRGLGQKTLMRRRLPMCRGWRPSSIRWRGSRRNSCARAR